ncbi:hypothetical protein LTR08_005456 [Meristemomyces frigidus]|nr:hypothetical protein LTR08_005456 [Meristemomyces frigidus]
MTTRRSNSTDEQLPHHAPPPWSTRNEAYWLPLWLSKPLPAGIYDPLEGVYPACTTSGFKGGLGMIQIVRYTGTPCGSYNELLLIPGNFEVQGGSQKGKSRMRIARIYVSQPETIYNGRRNWNIPKHEARFEFSAPPTSKSGSPPRELTVSVYPPRLIESHTETELPFFRVTLTPMRYLPAFPYSTTWTAAVLNSTFVQPPIPAGDDGFLCGTETWKTFEAVAATRKARLMWVKTAEADNVGREGHWPDVKPWPVGLWLEDATLDIPVPEESNH